MPFFEKKYQYIFTIVFVAQLDVFNFNSPNIYLFHAKKMPKNCADAAMIHTLQMSCDLLNTCFLLNFQAKCHSHYQPKDKLQNIENTFQYLPKIHSKTSKITHSIPKAFFGPDKTKPADESNIPCM